MSTYILTWNENRWTWEDLQTALESIKNGTPYERRWSCGNTHNIELGSRAFLLRLGKEPRGFIASGWITHAPYQAQHWDKSQQSKSSWYIRFTIDCIVDPKSTHPLDPRHFSKGYLPKIYWALPASGYRLPDEAASELEDLWWDYVRQSNADVGEPDPEISIIEGYERWHFIRHRSRERSLRTAKIAEALENSHDGRIRCEVPGCGFDFESKYGEIAKGFVEVHHLRPLSEAAGPFLTRLSDLAIVCSNCHRMIHLGGLNRPLQDLIHNCNP